MNLTAPPAEWAPHRAMWLGFPSHAELWEEDLDAGPGRGGGPGPRPGRARAASACALLVGGDEARGRRPRACWATSPASRSCRGLFGDIWLRDTGPIFFKRGDARGAPAFRFNGWGGKYELEHDDTVADQIAAAAGAPLADHDFVLEGGALDHDGEGTVLTTAPVPAQPQPQPRLDRGRGRGGPGRGAGRAGRCCGWATACVNDHTDGHVDNLARFVAPGVVACPVAFGRGRSQRRGLRRRPPGCWPA